MSSNPEDFKNSSYEEIISRFLDNQEISSAEAEILRNIHNAASENFERIVSRLYIKYSTVPNRALFAKTSRLVHSYEEFLEQFQQVFGEERTGDVLKLEFSIGKSNSRYVQADLEKIKSKGLIPPDMVVIMGKVVTYHQNQLRIKNISHKLLELAEDPNAESTEIQTLQHRLESARSFQYTRAYVDEVEELYFTAGFPIISLLDTIDKGRIDSSRLVSSKLTGKMTGYLPYYDMRVEFENVLQSLSEQEVNVSPLYGALAKDMQDAAMKLGKRYDEIVIILSDKVIPYRSSFVLTDSTTAGYAIEDITALRAAANPPGIEKYDENSIRNHLKLLNNKHTDFTFEINSNYVKGSKSRESKDRVSTRPTGKSTQAALISYPYATKLEYLIDLLKQQEVVDQSELIEAQVFGTFAVDDIEIIQLSKEASSIWDQIIEFLRKYNPSLYYKVLALSGKIIIRE